MMISLSYSYLQPIRLDRRANTTCYTFLITMITTSHQACTLHHHVFNSIFKIWVETTFLFIVESTKSLCPRYQTPGDNTFQS